MIGRRDHHQAEAFAEALEGHKPDDASLAELVSFAERLCESASVTPSPEFTGALRTQLLAQAATELAAPAPARRKDRRVVQPQPSRARRRASTLAGVVITALSGTIVVTTSASALPGDLLYPLKRTVESVELTLQRGDASKGATQLAHATERLAEARRLGDAAPDKVTDALEAFSASAAQGSERLFTVYESEGKADAIRTVNDFAVKASQDLGDIAPDIPPQAADALASAATEVSRLAATAQTLCLSCATKDVQALVSRVASLADLPVVTPAQRAGTTAPRSSGTVFTSPSSGKQQPAPGRTAPTRGSQPPAAPGTPRTTTSPAVPAPAPSTQAPGLKDVTDPLIGGVLGDENQQGLIPGLLGGLLGSNN